MQKKELVVSALENGTVIDHIKDTEVFNVLRILDLEKSKDPLYIGSNLDSKKYGKKGLIKVANRFFKPEEINKIALVSPHASIIEIRNFEVIKKNIVSLPKEIKGITKCMNPNCITNHQPIETQFLVIENPEIKLKCKYCEKFTSQENIEFV